MEIDIDHLYRRYGPMVLRRCRQLLRNEAQAVDMLQEVFMRILERRQDLHGEAPSSLLYRIATNLCLNRIRDERRRSELAQEHWSSDLVEEIAAIPDALERLHVDRLLERVFRRQPESTRTIALLHWHDGMTLEEVADTVGMSVSGVRKRLRQLQESLPNMPGEIFDD